eukprot:272801-Chlamydomonas_euryale.AAC.1
MPTTSHTPSVTPPCARQVFIVPAEVTTLEVAVSPGSQEGVNMRSLVLTLIEIASAFEYLHRMGVVHCGERGGGVCVLGGLTLVRVASAFEHRLGAQRCMRQMHVVGRHWSSGWRVGKRRRQKSGWNR